MKMIAINGSPRKNWNTARLLKKTLEGAVSAGAETKLFHLIDFSFHGCISCFACKKLGGPSLGRCAVRDELSPLLDELHSADAVAIGSPLYLMSETAATRAFLERWIFQYLVYTNPPRSRFGRRIRTAMIYTMNLPESAIESFGADHPMRQTCSFIERVIGPCECLRVTDTLQFADYSCYETDYFDPAAKKKRHEEEFPKDEQRAFELGKRLTEPIVQV